MNREDRAITDQTDCIQLLSRCDTLRLGLWDGAMPYKVMLERYHSTDYPVERCRGLTHTAVYKITLDSLTGKRNLPESD